MQGVKDNLDRFFLDFDPYCFKKVVSWLRCVSMHGKGVGEGGDRRDRGVAAVAVSAPVVAAEMEPPFRELVRHLGLEDVMYPESSSGAPPRLAHTQAATYCSSSSSPSPSPSSSAEAKEPQHEGVRGGGGVAADRSHDVIVVSDDDDEDQATLGARVPAKRLANRHVQLSGWSRSFSVRFVMRGTEEQSVTSGGSQGRGVGGGGHALRGAVTGGGGDAEAQSCEARGKKRLCVKADMSMHADELARPTQVLCGHEQALLPGGHCDFNVHFPRVQNTQVARLSAPASSRSQPWLLELLEFVLSQGDTKVGSAGAAGTQFPCFSGTKVQILRQALQAFPGWRSSRGTTLRTLR
jgi:hypothetical protein